MPKMEVYVVKVGQRKLRNFGVSFSAKNQIFVENGKTTSKIAKALQSTETGSISRETVHHEV